MTLHLSSVLCVFAALLPANLVSCTSVDGSAKDVRQLESPRVFRRQAELAVQTGSFEVLGPEWMAVSGDLEPIAFTLSKRVTFSPRSDGGFLTREGRAPASAQAADAFVVEGTLARVVRTDLRNDELVGLARSPAGYEVELGLEAITLMLCPEAGTELLTDLNYTRAAWEENAQTFALLDDETIWRRYTEGVLRVLLDRVLAKGELQGSARARVLKSNRIAAGTVCLVEFDLVIPHTPSCARAGPGDFDFLVLNEVLLLRGVCLEDVAGELRLGGSGRIEVTSGGHLLAYDLHMNAVWTTSALAHFSAIMCATSSTRLTAKLCGPVHFSMQIEADEPSNP
jgi:hypothetical protein